MRHVLPLATLVLLATPVFAQNLPQTTPPATPPAATPSPTPSSATSHTTAPATHHRLTMDERFTKANTTHDGQLTLEQAKTGYPTLVRHFTEIDATKKGYITEDDIRAWEKAQREKRHEAQQHTTTPNKS